MKRILAIALIGGLIGGIAGTQAMAKKKPKPKPKPVPVDVSYYMHRNSCGEETDATSLSTVDAVDEGNACGSLYAGAPNEVAINADAGPISADVWAATDGVPFTLNATKDITGSITVSSFQGDSANPGAVSAGQATLDVVLTGNDVSGTSVTLGSASKTYTVTPDKVQYTSDFSITPDAALNNAKFSSLELTTTMRGPALMHAFFELDDPASFFRIPTIVLKKK